MTLAAPVSSHEAKAELARRELARRKLLVYTEYLYPWYQTGKLHKIVAKALEEVLTYIKTYGRSGVGRLIIEMPPRTGKTELVSKVFPSWLLGKMPDKKVMMASYAADLAHKNSRAVRENVESRKFQNIFGDRSLAPEPVMLAWDSRSVKSWSLANPHRGEVIANGVGGGFTGFGGHLLIVDDPFKNREEAESEKNRDKVWEWWTSSFYTRREMGAAIVIVMTRWHEDDLVGRLLKQMATLPGADQYTVLSAPALAFEPDTYAEDEAAQQDAMLTGRWLPMKDLLGRKPGQSVWPEKFTAEDYLLTKQNIGSYDWSSLYQQQPVPITGGFFQGAWRRELKAPEGLRWVRYWDLAVSEKKTADRTASAAIAYDAEGTLYIKDMVKGRWAWPKTRDKMHDVHKSIDDIGVKWGVENVAFQLAAFQDLARDARFRGRPMLPIKPEGDKYTRALPLQTLQEIGKVVLIEGPWVEDFIAEARGFKGDGTSLHDDQIDSVTGGMQMLRRTLEGKLFY